MDLERIERALEVCHERYREYAASINTPNEHYAINMLDSAASFLVDGHSDDLLRLVRAMRWLIANEGSVECVCSDHGDWMAADWDVNVKQFGNDPLAAIEAAMTDTPNQPRAT